MRILVMHCDITELRVDAIVNAANSTLMGGGGVDGAIHAKAGPELLIECMKLRKKYPKGLPIGEAVATNAYNLSAKIVIHTVGPVYGKEDISLLKNCYTNSLKIAEEHACKTIAFPAISTGAYGVPVEKSALLVKDVLQNYTSSVIEDILLVLFSHKSYGVYKKVF